MERSYQGRHGTYPIDFLIRHELSRLILARTDGHRRVQVWLVYGKRCRRRVVPRYCSPDRRRRGGYLYVSLVQTRDPSSLMHTVPHCRYHLSMVFGGGEFLMELVETITDVPGFDSAWVDFCKYYNASNAEYVRSAFDRSLKCSYICPAKPLDMGSQ